MSYDLTHQTIRSRRVVDSSLTRRQMPLAYLFLATLMLSIIVTGVVLAGATDLWGGNKLVAGSEDPPIIKEVVVRRGDTLWSLARQHGPGQTDIRIIVDRIREINGLDKALIQPGMTLRIPGV